MEGSRFGYKEVPKGTVFLLLEVALRVQKPETQKTEKNNERRSSCFRSERVSFDVRRI